MITVHTPAGTFTARDETLANEILGAFGTTVAAAHTAHDDEPFGWDDDTLARTFTPLA